MKISVDIKQLEKLKKDIENILPPEKDNNKPYTPKIVYRKYELTLKEKEIYEYIRTNPGTSKQQVVNHFVGRHSRRPVFKTISRLEEHGFITVKKDEKNRQTSHLSINYDNYLVSLIENIRFFKNEYFDLIDKAIKISINEDKEIFKKMYDQDYNLGEALTKSSSIDKALTLPFNFLTMIHLIINLQPWQKSSLGTEIVQRRFSILNNILQEILAKLFKSFSYDKEPNLERSKRISLQLLWQNFNFNPNAVVNYLKAFKAIGLSIEAERILDLLWVIGQPVLGYFDYSYRNILPWEGTESKDWRDIISDYYGHSYKPISKKQK